MTYEEYYQLVREQSEGLKNTYDLNDEEIDKYLKEREDVVQNDYKYAMYQLRQNEITLEQAKHASVYATAFNLYMLFE